MINHNLQELQAYCDAVVQNGKALSISWDGGNDSGCYYLNIDDKAVVSLTDLQHSVLNHAQNCIGYFGFDGDFSTEGCVAYDLEKHCFVGGDRYSESESEELTCAIKVRIPKDIWFDSLIIRIETYNGDGVSFFVEPFIKNGPNPDNFSIVERRLQQEIIPVIETAIAEINDFDSMGERLDIPRRDFTEEGLFYAYTITSLGYTKWISDVKDIIVDFVK